ncbi:MAG: ParB/RepB/Spo0J family partition protein [Chitinivibrionales bacterium]|nr:ParB/RepB/Spo0J family partition protein [Chitinivibrionales bacterium]MBD3397396.1 ParB/RepB/Spo0J family partition protein [Chitinivibrionales bacterium]
MANIKTRRALGRGLSSLIPAPDDKMGPGIVLLPADTLIPNPFQPRSDFDEEELRSLADSIQTQGLLQPVIARRSGRGYQVVSGERRLRALKLLGETEIPCIVKETVSDREMLEIALVENIQREDLNEIEKARGYDRLLEECGLSHEQLSTRLGKSRSAVTNTLRLLKLPAPIQEMVRAGDLSMGHARALLAETDPKRQQRLAQRVAAEGTSVRDLEKALQKKGKARKKGIRAHAADPDTQQVIEKLQYRFGTAVDIVSRGARGGRIEIQFYDKDDLNRILDLLLG